MAKYKICYAVEIEAKDRSEARRIAIQKCPTGDIEVTVWELDEAGYEKGRIL